MAGKKGSIAKQTTISDAVNENTAEELIEASNGGSQAGPGPEETTELVATAGTDLASQEDFINDPDQFLQLQEDEDEDSIETLPRLRIDQKSKDDAGSLICEDMAQNWDKMELVLLRKSGSRILWPEKFNKDNKALCKSHDGKIPEPEDKDNDTYEPKAESCTKCPLSKWKTEDGKRVAPRCDEVKDLMVVDTTLMIPFFFSVSALGLSACNKSLVKPLKLRAMSLSAKRKQAGQAPAHSCMFSFKLSTRYDERDSGNSYQPVFSDIQELSDEEKDMFVQVAIGCMIFSPHTRPVEQDYFGGSGDGGGGNNDGTQDEAFPEREEF